MRVPRATYRLQLNGDFTFSRASETVPYLDQLGVSDLYASPYTRSRPGSPHGYDVVDHNSLDPEIGGPEEYETLVSALAERGMGQILDLVPNHMGIGSENARWLDVLEHGPAASCAHFFDIDWYPVNRSNLWGRVLLPVLGDHYRTVLESGGLKLRFDPEEGSFSVNYYEHRCPIDPKTYPRVFEHRPELPDSPELLSLVTAFGNLPGRGAPEKVDERNRDAAVHKGRLSRLYAASPEVARAVDRCVERLNSGAAGDFETLHRLLEEQAFRLAYWRVSSDEINYRRFFSIDDLAGIRVEDERVFDATHKLVLELVARGAVSGLRIDHVDGLYDPEGYLRRLQSRAAEVLGAPGEEEPVYLLVEKILAGHERLPEGWPVAGTTGYEFANLVNGLFVDPAGEPGLERAYLRFLGHGLDFEDLLYRCKKAVMRGELASELNVLSRRLLSISEGPADPSGVPRRSYDFTIDVLREALAEVVAAFPVYRTYARDGELSEDDRRHIEWAVARAEKRSTAADTAVFGFVREVLLFEVGGGEEGYRRMVEDFVMKFQQYTGPVMAKGMEDTALYIYNRLASLNEVGGEPDRFGVSVAAFHHVNAGRARDWPHSMLTTATHDTKRGEDVRARIDVLSELPDEWRGELARWSRTNRSRRREADGEAAPSRNDEYLLYQTLLGVWPPEGPGEGGLEELAGRVEEYLLKAVREAEVHTSWVNMDEEYEAAVSHFVRSLLSPGEHNLFLEEFAPFARRVARAGALNGLSQTLLKLTAPGVPDIYQGTELWDLSLVDPDNRRPVDYPLRREMLRGLPETGSGAGLPGEVRGLLRDGRWESGLPKLYLTRQALALRRERPGLFAEGEYVPLAVEGALAGHLCAFARRRGEEVAVTVAPRLQARFSAGEGSLLPDPAVWEGTRIDLSGLPGGGYRDVLTGAGVEAETWGGRTLIPAGALLGEFPVALLAGS
ncbi:MAG: malto-oligosyltrehalose synthase [Rubrobacter sp.]|nr:malto-oligosyltrehalose synthase [Rubrobacter sp.]